jgi:peptidoglycan/LPS O-acetylase OafA/YrhL
MSEPAITHDDDPQRFDDADEGGSGGASRWLVGLGAALVIAGLFLTWYHVVRPNGFAEDTTGWQTFTKLRFVILGGGILALISLALVPTRAVVLGRLLIGVVIAVLEIRRIVSPPDLPGSTVTAQLGIYVSLLGALGIVFGGLAGSTAEDDDDELADRPTALAPAPAGALPAPGETAPGESVVDADVVGEPDRADLR